MKHLAIRLASSLLTFVIGIASFGLLHASRPSSYTGDERAVLRVEHQYIQAHLDGDTATLNSILADEFTIRSCGRVATKADRLDMLADPDFAFEDISTDDVEVKVNGDSAVVTGEAYVETRYDDETFTSPTYRFTRTYEKRDGRWQIVSVVVRR